MNYVEIKIPTPIILLLFPAGILTGSAMSYLTWTVLAPVVVTQTQSGDEEISEWAASVVNPDTEEEVVFDATCTEEVHDGEAVMTAPCEAVGGTMRKASGVAIGPINTVLPEKPDAGYSVSHLNENQLRWKMYEEGYRNLAGMSVAKLRQLRNTYLYDQFFWSIHRRTGFPVAVIFSYFTIEGTYKGVETPLLREHFNCGGVKYRGIGYPVEQNDDCYSDGVEVPCLFEGLNSWEEMESLWASVLNNARYSRCKSYNNVSDICKCLYEQGYHTSSNWRLRANVAKRYWYYRGKFPVGAPQKFMAAGPEPDGKFGNINN